MTPLDRAVIERAATTGPLPFDQVMDLALYDPEHGFYAAGGRAGPAGDFLTSPEVGPLFGAVVARALDRWWTELGRPDPFTVVEAAAGVGTLARTVLAAEPACAAALRYRLVERSARLRAHHGDHLDLVTSSGEDDPVGGRPQVVSSADLPAGPVVGVVLANELLDNLAVGLLERTPSGWDEVRVGTGPGSGPGALDLVEVRVPAEPADAARIDALAPDAAVGARVPLARQASAWVAEAVGRIARGRVVAFDYVEPTAVLARRAQGEWLRTYRGHQRGGPALAELGTQDITCQVPLDQLAEVRVPTEVVSQARFLADHGLDELVADGRRIWAERAHLGDLVAIRARSRVGEAEALTDPDGLGAFTVMSWSVG